MDGKFPNNQHCIWQNYLRAWAHDGQVWCVRAPKKHAFRTNTSNIGSETYFCRIEELDEHDIAYLESVISGATAGELRELNKGWIRIFQTTFALRKAIAEHGADASVVVQLRSEMEAVEQTLVEQYHAGVEDEASVVGKIGS